MQLLVRACMSCEPAFQKHVQHLQPSCIEHPKILEVNPRASAELTSGCVQFVAYTGIQSVGSSYYYDATFGMGGDEYTLRCCLLFMHALIGCQKHTLRPQSMSGAVCARWLGCMTRACGMSVSALTAATAALQYL